MKVLMSCGCKIATLDVQACRCDPHPEGFPYRQDFGQSTQWWDGTGWRSPGGAGLPDFAWQRLRYVTSTSSKFWSILPYDRSTHSHVYLVHFGKIGTAGQHRWKSFPDRLSMLVAVDNIVAQKRAKGYVDVAPELPTQTAEWSTKGPVTAGQQPYTPMKKKPRKGSRPGPKTRKKKPPEVTPEKVDPLCPVAVGCLGSLEFED